eukprot:484181_1
MNEDELTATTVKKYNNTRRKKKRRKRKNALFTKKKVRTTTSNLRIPRLNRRKTYRDRCKLKKHLKARGQNVDILPQIDHEHPLVPQHLCKSCNKFFRSKTLLLNHISSMHKDITNESDHNSAATNNENPPKTAIIKKEFEEKDNGNNHSAFKHIKPEIIIKKEPGLIIKKEPNDYIHMNIDTSTLPILGLPMDINDIWICERCIKINTNKNIFCESC